MKNLVFTAPGRAEITTSPEPQPIPGNIIVRVRRIGICGTDLHAFQGNQPFFTYPRIPGHEIAAVVEDTPAPTQVKKGDEITIMPYMHCGTCRACKKGLTNCCAQLKVMGVHTNGGMSEYLSVPEHLVIPGNGLSEMELASVEPLAIGAHALRRGQVSGDDQLIVVGAGPIGFGIAALALTRGINTMVLDTDAARREFCKATLKTIKVLDPTDPATHEHVAELTHGEMADVVMDASGNKAAMESMLGFLGHGGRMVLVGLQREAVAYNQPEFHRREATLMSSRNATREDFNTAMQILGAGKFPVMDYVSHELSFDDAPIGFSHLTGIGNSSIWKSIGRSKRESIMKVHVTL